MKQQICYVNNWPSLRPCHNVLLTWCYKLVTETASACQNHSPQCLLLGSGWTMSNSVKNRLLNKSREACHWMLTVCIWYTAWACILWDFFLWWERGFDSVLYDPGPLTSLKPWHCSTLEMHIYSTYVTETFP